MVGFPYDDLERWCTPYPPDMFASQLETMANLWQQGLGEMPMAIARADEDKRPLAEAELRYARAALLYFRSAANQVRFLVRQSAVACWSLRRSALVNPPFVTRPTPVRAGRRRRRRTVVPGVGHSA